MQNAAVFCFCLALVGQPASSSSPSKKEELQDFNARRDKFRAQAKRAYESEIARQKRGDCLDAKSTYDANICYGAEIKMTDGNWKSYQDAVRSLLSLQYPGTSEQPSQPGIAGPALNSRERVAEFNHLEDEWRAYLQNACEAAGHQFGGGTGGPSFAMQTHLQLVRGHIRELNNIYGMLLTL